MNKTAIKNFAVWARQKLISDITYKAKMLGITEDGIAEKLPQSTADMYFFDVGTKNYSEVSGVEIRQRNDLIRAIRNKEYDFKSFENAFEYIVEEAAYTWFNRLIAIRFMEVNDYLPSGVRVLSSVNRAKNEPDFVTNPFDTDLEFTPYEQDQIIQLKDKNKLDELFRMLFIKQCNKLNEILPELFEQTDDYTEILLTISFTDKDGVVYRLVNDIDEDDFNVEKEGQVEIIGWLYQYWNTEPKDKVFADLKKNIKITKDKIPAATQIFTPDWIVRYMVENSLGRLWINHLDSSFGYTYEINSSLRTETGERTVDVLKKNWEYYLDEAEQIEEVEIQIEKVLESYRNITLEDIKFIDPCMGSGHVLMYAFDVLMQIYESMGWTQRDAARSIVWNNLYGLDIDGRAAQLAYFAVMMKARRYDRRFLKRGIRPNLYKIKESNEISRDVIDYIANGDKKMKSELETVMREMHDATQYGSIINVTPIDFEAVYNRIDETFDDISMQRNEVWAEVLPVLRVAETLARKYDVVCTNPPYMGLSGANNKLNAYVKKYYPNSKSDLFAVFMEKCRDLAKRSGYHAMITQHSWMFLSSFEKLRKELQANTIINMVHLGARAFDEIGGEVVQTTAFVFNRQMLQNYNGIYVRLVDVTGEEQKRQKFLEKDSIYTAKQSNFEKIPGSPIAYWVSENFIRAFENLKMEDTTICAAGVSSGKNDVYLKLWYEINYNMIAINCNSNDEFQSSKYNYVYCNKGGAFRKWYGNNDYVAFWKKSHEFHRNGATYKHLLFKKGMTWSAITSGNFSARYYPDGLIFDHAAPSLFSIDESDLLYYIGLCNSNFIALVIKIINPTINTGADSLRKIPVIVDFSKKNEIENIAKENIHLSKLDWDAFETSWDFERHPLVPSVQEKQEQMDSQFAVSRMEKSGLVSWHFDKWKRECENRFNQLKANEEELNRIFIDIYGLQDELTPEVEDKDVTVRKADLQRDIKSLISYAVGCMFGRYSLDCDGLAYAGGDWDESKYVSFLPDEDNCIPICDDEYFEDDIVGLFVKFIETVYGKVTLEENLNFIANALGGKGNTSREVIRNYFLKDFIKDHIRAYQKRPIYWLFDSGKQNGFKALCYMHRWNADTTGNMRVEYLHRIQRVYEKEITRMQEIIDNSYDNKEISNAMKRREKLQKQLKETKEYDALVAHLALSRIDIDLDDGVKVNYEKVQTASNGKKTPILARI